MDADSPLFEPEGALATYGTLAPGEENHFVMLGIAGHWVDGLIRGYRFEATWGGADGYPAFVPAADGHHIPVKVFLSDEFDSHWRRIDDFEGPGYRRTVVEVLHPEDRTPIGKAYVYENLTDND
ncbi:MAG: gamma-glutamylcyclotransferase family protein [Acidimicrobiales bacterium]